MIEPNAQGYLPESDGHEVAWYEFGNPEGFPVLFLHGGPGSGFSRDYLEFFPLDRVRFVTFDQRGSGASRPFAKLEGNTTERLLFDIERLRKMLEIQKWAVAGHSWGATLSVIYARAHPAVCDRILLASFFGAQPQDQQWSFEGVRFFFPEEVDALHALRPDKDEPFAVWVCRALKDDNLKEEVAFRLSCLSRISCALSPKSLTRGDITPESIGRWQVLMHYGAHNFFLKPGELYEGLEVLTMPVSALQGRFDMDCPPVEVQQLKDRIPHMDLTFVAGNHSAMEEPMQSALKLMIEEAL